MVSQPPSRTFGLAAGAAGHVKGVPISGALLAVILGLGVHVNLSPSARRLHRTATGSPTRRTRVAACVRPAAGLPGRPEQAAGRDCARLGVQPVGKPVVAVAGDVVEYGLGGCAAGSSLFTSRVE